MPGELPEKILVQVAFPEPPFGGVVVQEFPEEIIIELGSGPPILNIVLDKVAVGDINGVNTVFQTEHNFSLLWVYKNGVRQHKNEDYTITGANQFTFFTAPEAGDIITYDYAPTGFSGIFIGGGGATIAATTNLIAGDGIGNGIDSGIAAADVVQKQNFPTPENENDIVNCLRNAGLCLSILFCLVLPSIAAPSPTPCPNCFGSIPRVLELPAGQSVRRNAGNTAFEAYIPSAGGGTPGGSPTEFQYNNSGAFGGIPSLKYDGTIPATITLTGGNFTPNTGLLLQNTTPATLGNPKSSAAIQFTANSWNSTSNRSYPVDFRLYNNSSSFTEPDANLTLDYRVDGGAWATMMQFEAPGNTGSNNLPVVGISGELELTFGGVSIGTGGLPAGDGNLLLAGDVVFNNAPIISALSANNIMFRTQAANIKTQLAIVPNGTVANYPSLFSFFGTDYSADSTNWEQMAFISKGTADTYYAICTLKGGTGNVRPINIEATNSSGVTPQLVIGTDGGVSIGTGTQAGSTNLLVQGGERIASLTTNGIVITTGGNGTLAVATPTSTPTPSATLTPTPTATATSTPTPTPTATPTATVIAGFTAHFTNGGSAIVVDSTTLTPWTCPYSGTITGYSISADTGTCTLKTWKKANGTAIPTVADNISTSGVSLSSGTHIRSSTVSDFTTTTVTAGDMFMATVTATSGPTDITFQVEITR